MSATRHLVGATLLAAAVAAWWVLGDAPGEPPATPSRPAATALAQAEFVRPSGSAPTEAAVRVGRSTLERLRELVDADPQGALALAGEDEARAPDAPHADERSFVTMRALVHLGRIAAARDEATRFFERFPESPWGERVEGLTGVHPRRAYENRR